MKGGPDGVRGDQSSAVGATALSNEFLEEAEIRAESSFTYLSRDHRRSDLVRISSGVSSVLGYDPESFTNQRVIEYQDIVHDDDRQHFLSTIAHAVNRAAPFEIRYRAVGSSGRLRWLWERGRPILNPGTTRVTAIAGFVVEVTSLVDEFETRRAQAELEASLRSVVSVARRLRLNPPAPSSRAPPGSQASGLLPALCASPTPPTPDVLAELIELTGDRAGELSDADVNAIVRNVAVSLVSTTPNASRLALALSEALPLAVVCPDRLSSALYTLLRRAIRAGGANATPTVTTGILDASFNSSCRGAPELGVCIRITDPGGGVSPARLRHLFEPYGDDGTGETGLAMSLAWRAIASMEGRVTVEPLPTGELSISVILRQRTSTTAQPRASLIRAREAVPVLKATVLVVDDTPVVRRCTAQALKRAGFRVLVAESAMDALSLIESGADEIDVLVTDLVMPGATGQEIATAFRRCSPRAGILFMSGYSEESALSAEPRADHTAFLQKPFGFADLTAAVSNLVTSRPSSNG